MTHPTARRARGMSSRCLNRTLSPRNLCRERNVRSTAPLCAPRPMPFAAPLFAITRRVCVNAGHAERPLRPSGRAGRRYRRPSSRDCRRAPSSASWDRRELPPRRTFGRKVLSPNALALRSEPRPRRLPHQWSPWISRGDTFAGQQQASFSCFRAHRRPRLASRELARCGQRADR